MEPNFAAFQLIGQIALGIIGFSAILIGLSRTSEGFSGPDNFRVQLLTYSAFGAMFGSIIPFAIFSGENFETAWLMCFWIMSIYSVIGLIIFPRKMLHLRSLGHKDIFPIKDIGIIRAMNQVYGNEGEALDLNEIIKIADKWKPYRSVACWFLWRSIDGEEVSY